MMHQTDNVLSQFPLVTMFSSSFSSMTTILTLCPMPLIIPKISKELLALLILLLLTIMIPLQIYTTVAIPHQIKRGSTPINHNNPIMKRGSILPILMNLQPKRGSLPHLLAYHIPMHLLQRYLNLTKTTLLSRLLHSLPTSNYNTSTRHTQQHTIITYTTYKPFNKSETIHMLVHLGYRQRNLRY